MKIDYFKNIIKEGLNPFGQAYKNARASGQETFMYNGKKYSSDIKTRPVVRPTAPKPGINIQTMKKEPEINKSPNLNVDSGNDSIRPKLTAYSPQKSGSKSHKLEGGYSSSRPGPDQDAKDWKTWKVRGIQDYNPDDPKSYVTLAGHPSQYGKKYTIPSMKYVHSDGSEKELKNVRGYVHDTGKAFKGKDAASGQRFDIAMGPDWKPEHLNRQPWSMKNDVEFKHGWDERPQNIKVAMNKQENE